MIYMVKVSIVREVCAKDREEAEEKFWEGLEQDNRDLNTTTDIRLSDSMTITRRIHAKK